MAEQHFFSRTRIAAACRPALEGQTPQVILDWAVETFYPAADDGDGVWPRRQLHHSHARQHRSRARPRFQPGAPATSSPKRWSVREKIKKRYGIEVEYIRPEASVEEYEAEHGGPLYVIRPDQCCYDRKILPLQKAAVGYDAWMSAIRRDQTGDRFQASVVQLRTPSSGLVKVNPLLFWTQKDVWNFIAKNNIPYNPLHDRGYPSIGCWPCTAPAGAGEDERAGRWRGTGKKECGLHVVEHQDGSGI